MTALLRIVGCVWLALVVASLVIIYGVMWIWQVVMTATANPPPGAPISMLTIVAFVIPGFILIGLAAWLDRRR
jgi:hypothetical protein